MVIHATPRCERCAFATPVSDKKCFCIFNQCPYEKNQDPFNEKQRMAIRQCHAAEPEEKQEEKSRKKKAGRSSVPQPEIPAEKAEDDTPAETAL